MKYKILIYCITISTIAFSQSRTEALVLSLFKEKFSLMNSKDADKLDKKLDERLVFIHSNGNTENKSELIQNLKDKKWQIKSVDLRDVKIRVYKNNFAVINGKGLFHVQVNGTDVDTDLYFTEVWTHVKDGWLLASRHASKNQ